MVPFASRAAIAAAAGLTGWDGVTGVGVGVGNSDPGVTGRLGDGLPVGAVVLVVLVVFGPLFPSGVFDPEFAPLQAVRSNVSVMTESANEVWVFFMRRV